MNDTTSTDPTVHRSGASSPLTGFKLQQITQISFNDRKLDTLVIGESDIVRQDDRGVWLTRQTYRGTAWTSFYPWTSVFSLTYGSA